jgi:hypothetical protein
MKKKMLSGLQAKFCTRLFGDNLSAQEGRALPNRGGLSLLQIPGKAAVLFQRFAANRYVEFVHRSLSCPTRTRAWVTAAGTPASCKSAVAVPRRLGKDNGYVSPCSSTFACAFVVPLFPEPGSIDFTLGALRQSGLEGLAEQLSQFLSSYFS